MLDMVIIGGGPSGLACGIEAQRRGLTYCIVEKGGVADAIRRFPVDMTFFSTPDLLELGEVPFTTTNTRPNRIETLQYYRLVATRLGLHLRLHTRVTRIEPLGGDEGAGFAVHLASAIGQGDDATPTVLRAHHVVVATGYFDYTNRLNVPGEDLPHVSYYYDEPWRYAMSDVVVIGGRNSAVETALELYRTGARVTLVHRRADLGDSVKYWVMPDIRNRLKRHEVGAWFNHVVTAIRPGAVDLRHVETGATATLKADFVIPLIGYRPDEALLRAAGVRLDAQLVPDYNRETFETNVPGLYIAGSVACGCETWNIFIENGRAHARPLIAHILAKRQTPTPSAKAIDDARP